MAKKKGGKSNSNSSNNVAAKAAAAAPEVETPVPEPEPTPVAAPAPEEEAPAPAPAPTSTSTDAPDLQQQLEAAQAEIAKLREQLKAKDDEISRLRESKGPAAPIELPKSEDMQKLHERLGHLKKEQADAEAAREAAWRQLKSVVNEISKLASPPDMSKTPTLVSPTGA